MKINYWHYWFEKLIKDKKGKVKTDKSIRYTYKIFELLSDFSNNAPYELKRRFKQDNNDDEYLILKEIKGVFLFLKTKNSDIVKLINEEDLSVSDIETQLAKNNQSIAFASYIAFDHSKPIMAMGGTLNGPSIRAFETFINTLLRYLSLNIRFVFSPIGAQIKKSALSRFSFIGTTEIRIPKDSNFFSALVDYARFDTSDVSSIKNLSIKICTERGRSIQSAVTKLAEKITDAEKFKIKAKMDMEDKALDYFLYEQGQKSIFVDRPKNDDEALSEMRKAIVNSGMINLDANGKLYKKLSETFDIRNHLKSIDCWNNPALDVE